MHLNKKTIVIGGLPKPIGGVTTFLSRLTKAYPNYILGFIDLYPHSQKNIPNVISNNYILIKNKFYLPFKLIVLQLKYRNLCFFFNFSTTKSLLLFILTPKYRNEWTLMLHHGDLKNSIPKILLKYLLKKFDAIFALNERQIAFYQDIDMDLPIILESSYVPASLEEIDSNEKLKLKEIQKKGYKVIIGSGYPKYLYQHHLLIKIIDNNPNAYLFIFLYGDGELKEELMNIKHPRICVFTDKNEDIFNYYLSKCDLYIRPTLEDSFGIACADAVEFGVPVLASNVCVRYKNVIAYDVNNNEELYALSSKYL